MELRERAHDNRPWGSFEVFTKNEPSTVKLLTVREGEEFSLQTHAHRDEFWRVLEGAGTVIVGTDTHTAAPGSEFSIERGTPHRAQGGQGGLLILEIAFGAFDENDIVRLEDKYGRA